MLSHDPVSAPPQSGVGATNATRELHYKLNLAAHFVLLSIPDGPLLDGWTQLFQEFEGMKEAHRQMPANLIVYGDIHKEDDAISKIPFALRVNCKDVDCLSIRKLDEEAFGRGGGCAVLQKHVFTQPALLQVLATALRVWANEPQRELLNCLGFHCNRGKHRSRVCAEVFRFLCSPYSYIYSYLDDAWS